MVRLLGKKLRPAGLSPGSLLYIGSNQKHKVRLSVLEYTEESFTEKNDISLTECLEYLHSPSMTWIQVYGTYDPDVVALIGQQFKFHALVLEDILTTGQRSKLDVYQDQVFIVARFLQYDQKLKSLRDEQLSLVFGPNYLVSFMETPQEIFQPIKERLSQSYNRIRKEGSDYLAYALLDTLVDYYYFVLERLDTDLDQLEEEVLRVPETNTMFRLQQAKREMIILRKAIWPMRDVISRFLHLEPPFVRSSTQVYLHDIYDHTVQMIDIVEGFRDLISGLLDIYLSNINIRTNEIMKVLTIVSTIFVPLTFIASIYGMNFEFLPGLHHHWGFLFALLLMIIVGAFMLMFFYRKKWL